MTHQLIPKRFMVDDDDAAADDDDDDSVLMTTDSLQSNQADDF